jgi:hypothetical protein
MTFKFCQILLLLVDDMWRRKSRANVLVKRAVSFTLTWDRLQRHTDPRHDHKRVTPLTKRLCRSISACLTSKRKPSVLLFFYDETKLIIERPCQKRMSTLRLRRTFCILKWMLTVGTWIMCSVRREHACLEVRNSVVCVYHDCASFRQLEPLGLSHIRVLPSVS